jgi:RNAse (barnase) inhibitor barstar
LVDGAVWAWLISLQQWSCRFVELLARFAQVIRAHFPLCRALSARDAQTDLSLHHDKKGRAAMEIELWILFDALMKWVIIPMAAMLWVHNQKLGSHEKEVLRIMTLLSERKEQRDEDRAELKEALRDLRAAILRLDQRLADFTLAQSAQAPGTESTRQQAARRAKG